MSKKKKYILTIEFNSNEDRCEFIEEKLIEESSDCEVTEFGSIDITDYFSECDAICLLEFNIGKS
tara:strand:+ start:2273 stop:2467 length:195 start_codon:yes stop_codon:yes gene_type:complete